MIYEGSVRFEHCYRLDLDETIAPSHRRACWQDWLSRHTYGQSGDRLSHARRRLDELNHGEQATLPILDDAGVQQRQVNAPLPMPTNIHNAPPPKSPQATTSAAPPPASVAPTPPPPDWECVENCRKQWQACALQAQCREASANASQGGASSTAVTVASSSKNQKDACSMCSRTFKTCMVRCAR
jgi:hypothetical protein